MNEIQVMDDDVETIDLLDDFHPYRRGRMLPIRADRSHLNNGLEFIGDGRNIPSHADAGKRWRVAFIGMKKEGGSDETPSLSQVCEIKSPVNPFRLPSVPTQMADMPRGWRPSFTPNESIVMEFLLGAA